MTTQTELVSQTKTSPSTSQARFLSVLQIYGLILLTLHLAAFQFAEELSWSLWPYTLLPAWLGWLLALLIGTLIIPTVTGFIIRWLHAAWQAIPGKAYPQCWFVGIALASGFPFWLARLNHLRWGDSYLLSIALSYHDLDLRVIYNWQAPFTVFLHQRLWQFVADPLLGWPVENVYATISILCGIIFVYVLLNFVRRLGRTTTEAIILAGLILTTGSIQLFFGYVENYTIISLGLIVTMFLAWRALQGEIQPVWPVLGLAVTNAFHPSTVFIWPGMWLLVWFCWRLEYVTLRQAAWQLVVPPLILGGMVLALMEGGSHGLDAFLGVDRPGGGDGIWFVPIFETTTEWQHYTMFSPAHIIDWLNLHLLISPFGLVILLLALPTLWQASSPLFDSEPDRRFAIYLAVSATMYILFTWLWNPDYGARKDWDLFAPSAFVYTLLAGYLLVRLFSEREKLTQAGVFVIAVSLLHTGVWVFANTHDLPR